jgi:hypothetical protein
MHRGYIKLYRKIRDNPRLHDPDYLALWIWLLIQANHSPQNEILGGKTIICNPGQFTTGRKQLSELSGISESKITRILNIMEIEQQIEQQTTNTNRLISITNWSEYQQSEQQNEKPVNNKRTTDEQQLNTLEEVKNEKNDKNTSLLFKSNLKDITLREEEFKESIRNTIYDNQTKRDFFDYWSEKDRSGKKMRFEKEPTWDLNKRLIRWINNKKFSGTQTTRKQFGRQEIPMQDIVDQMERVVLEP